MKIGRNRNSFLIKYSSFDLRYPPVVPSVCVPCVCVCPVFCQKLTTKIQISSEIFLGI